MKKGDKVKIINHFLADVWTEKTFIIESEEPYNIGEHQCVSLERYGSFRIANLELIEE